MPDLAPAAVAHALLTLARTKPSEDLTRVYERIGGMVAAYGSVRQVVQAMLSAEIPVEVAPDPLFVRSFCERVLEESSAQIAAWEGGDFGMHAIAGTSYPRQLEEIADAPPLLFHLGDAALLSAPGIAVVGTRKASDDGIRRAQLAAETLVELEITVISGMAVGIDTAAHQAALRAGGRTIAVMGTSITRRYPASNRLLADNIVASGGALATEFSPDATTHPWHFLRRNRTMSGLALGTLVIEAAETSGAKSQAIAAVQHGRPVFLPASLVRAHAWAEKLVHEGLNGAHAIEVSDAGELAELVRPSGSHGDEPSFG